MLAFTGSRAVIPSLPRHSTLKYPKDRREVPLRRSFYLVSVFDPWRTYHRRMGQRIMPTRQKQATVPITGRLLLDRGASTGAFLAAVRPGGYEHRIVSLPGNEFAEHHENREQEDKWKTSADDPNSNLDRKRICDANGVAKNVD
jgi:hypothetical protein